MILSWDQPEKVMAKEEWKSISADSAPPGVFTPNMSEEDKLKWKAKYFGGRLPRVEIRKTTVNGTQVLIMVTLGGFPHKVDKYYPDGMEHKSQKCNVRISQNGPAFYSFDDWNNFNAAIEEARQVLLAKK